MLDSKALEKLKNLLGTYQVITDPAELLVYETDAALDRGMPDAVAFAHVREDVQKVAQWSAEFGVPLISRGAGTGLSGGAVAIQGGVILEFSRMNRILEIDSVGRSATVEPGVVNLTLDESVKRQGLYYPPDPASGRSATLGGNVAENAGGPHCFKYGVTTNYITGLEFVLPGGQVLTSGGYAFDYPEYDWTGLLVGSEGTLALVTKIQTRLLRLPPGVKTMMAAFDSVESAGAAVSAVISAGLIPATMEMMDQKIARIIEDYAHPGIPTDAGALLIVEVDGYPESLEPQIEEISSILQLYGGHDLRVAKTAEEREKIWYARKSAAGAMARLAPAYLLLDGTVPRSALAQALLITNQICDKYQLQVGYVFHAGDGNLHPFILTDPRNADHLHRAHQAGQEFMEAVVALGGSITGEHGVGIEKRPYLSLMYSPTDLGVMQDIKQIFDPGQLFNPGKIFPEVDAERQTSSSLTPLPPIYFTPQTTEQASEGLAALSRAREVIQISGGNLGNEPLTQGRTLSTRYLNGITAYSPHDLYVTARAGTTIAELDAFLEREGLQTALLSPWPESTLGGMLASNLNSPLRMRYGGLRDQVLAMTIVFSNGKTMHAGRPVVKNVAGYDLPKIMVGSLGTLGLIADVTLKISALPRTRHSLLVPVADMKHGIKCSQACLSVALVSTGIILGKFPHILPLEAGHYTLAYTAEGLPEDVHSEIALVRKKLAELGAPEPIELEGRGVADLWKQFLTSTQNRQLLLRIGLPSKNLGQYLINRESIVNKGDFLVDIASGLVYSSTLQDGLGEAQIYLEDLRKPALSAGGYTVVLDSPIELTGKLERWGYRPQTLELMKRLKAHWDPAGIMNPGIFLV